MIAASDISSDRSTAISVSSFWLSIAVGAVDFFDHIRKSRVEQDLGLRGKDWGREQQEEEGQDDAGAGAAKDEEFMVSNEFGSAMKINGVEPLVALTARCRVLRLRLVSGSFQHFASSANLVLR